MSLDRLERAASVWCLTICANSCCVFNRRRMLRWLRWLFLLLTRLILESFLILRDYLTITAFKSALIHAYFMVDSMHLLNMLDCAHIRVCRLLRLIVIILRRLLGKHLLCLVSQGGLGIELAVFFRTHYMLFHKLPRILRKYFSVIVLLKLCDTGTIRVL